MHRPNSIVHRRVSDTAQSSFGTVRDTPIPSRCASCACPLNTEASIRGESKSAAHPLAYEGTTIPSKGNVGELEVQLGRRAEPEGPVSFASALFGLESPEGAMERSRRRRGGSEQREGYMWNEKVEQPYSDFASGDFSDAGLQLSLYPAEQAASKMI
jgi:hypothetical protein